ncbi:MAG: ABC transporter substrate-binding protein [Xanthobacteraceae bacterium]|nr:ABC transporter substrate-binding protein [Xanthobacteraceae bacterium]
MAVMASRRPGTLLSAAVFTAVAAWFAWLSPLPARAETVRIGIQKTGSFAWQLDVIRRHGFARDAGIDIALTEFASPDAGKLALNSGAVDLIVSDWLWVARERALGGKLLFYPYSSGVGAVMVRSDSPLHRLADLRGHVLAVAGGPLDKSWLILRASALREGIDLKREATLQYGAPPLIMEKAKQSGIDASLNFWNFCARLEAQGFRQLVDMRSVETGLGLAQPVALIGFVFSEQFAERHHELIDRFLAVTGKANDIMTTSDAEWDAIRPLMQVDDDATFEVFRARTREGMPRRPVAAEEADARALFKVLAELGGTELVGPSTELDAGLYYHPAVHGE